MVFPDQMKMRGSTCIHGKLNSYIRLQKPEFVLLLPSPKLNYGISSVGWLNNAILL